jgi:hypothetical protein
MLQSEFLKNQIAKIQSSSFETLALDCFHFQAMHNQVYQEFIHHLGIQVKEVKSILEIPFLPIDAFKFHEIKTDYWDPQTRFLSSGTEGQKRSVHALKDLDWYKSNVVRNFELFFPDFREFDFFALLPGYLENKNSSLIQMFRYLESYSIHHDSTKLYSNDFKLLHRGILSSLDKGRKVFLLGVSFALLDFCIEFPISDNRLVVMETGGMKTTGRSYLKEEILQWLSAGFDASDIVSEFGMTELLSQAYAMDGKNYACPTTLKVMVSDLTDPFCFLDAGHRGRLNIIDLANLDTCCFIQTGDAGLLQPDGKFQVLGRITGEDLRGCNLMYE